MKFWAQTAGQLLVYIMVVSILYVCAFFAIIMHKLQMQIFQRWGQHTSTCRPTHILFYNNDFKAYFFGRKYIRFRAKKREVFAWNVLNFAQKKDASLKDAVCSDLQKSHVLSYWVSQIIFFFIFYDFFLLVLMNYQLKFFCFFVVDVRKSRPFIKNVNFHAECRHIT